MNRRGGTISIRARAKQLAGRHGLYRSRLALVWQPRPFLYSIRSLLADRILSEPDLLEYPGVPRLVADNGRAAASDPAILDRTDSAGAPDLGRWLRLGVAVHGNQALQQQTTKAKRRRWPHGNGGRMPTIRRNAVAAPSEGATKLSSMFTTAPRRPTSDADCALRRQSGRRQV